MGVISNYNPPPTAADTSLYAILKSVYAFGAAPAATVTPLSLTIPTAGYWVVRAFFHLLTATSTAAPFNLLTTDTATMVGSAPVFQGSDNGNYPLLQEGCAYLTAGTVVSCVVAAGAGRANYTIPIGAYIQARKIA